MPHNALITWKGSPFLKLLLPLMAGIVTQHYSHRHSTTGPPAAFSGMPLITGTEGPPILIWLALILSVLLLITWSKLPIATRFRYYWCTGIAINCLLLTMGYLISWFKDIRHHPHWVGLLHQPPVGLVVTIQEPLSEKAATWKTLVNVESAVFKDRLQPLTGKLLLYFRKDSALPQLQYGDRIAFTKPLQPIKGAGNPGAFDYSAYCARQGIHHQVYLKHGEFAVLSPGSFPWLSTKNLMVTVYHLREKILGHLRKNIPGTKECGLAEALLIGYKDHLDQQLVQAYSETGVVHVIAISGLHLGLVYLLLTLICKPFGKHTTAQWLKPLLIISGLWLFSLLAGASPSVLRSAVMFTCLAAGDAMARTSSPYNSLAASAFLLLCYQPTWLWDTGFQLSYAAVLSITLFQQPIYHLFYFHQKLYDLIWKLVAGTLAAQILTLPITLYYFHQFPLLFLFTNLVAIPLSSLILLGEIFLCAIAYIPLISQLTGQALHWLIRLLNNYIETFSNLSWSTINNLEISLPQVWLMYGCIAAVSAWLLHRHKRMLIISLCGWAIYAGMDLAAAVQASQQQKLIVYHVPQFQAVDFIMGRKFLFKGDSGLLNNRPLQAFHLAPARCRYQVKAVLQPGHVAMKGPLVQFGNKSILFIDPTFGINLNRRNEPPNKPAAGRIPVDLIILSHNPPIHLETLAALFSCKQLVIDGSNTPWKAAGWLQDCKRLGIPCHSTASQGAFVLTMY